VNGAPGLILGDATRVDVSAVVPDYDESFFVSNGLSRLEAYIKQNVLQAQRIPQSVRLGPPISRPSKIICVGLNFRDHAHESKMEIPKEPVLFSRRQQPWWEQTMTL
jgi:2,4-didehydro-3-deoxy-L-rhamnonate hydrolase